MYQTLIIIGIVCIISAVVGGGLTAFGIKVPPLSGGLRVVAVLLTGAVLIVVGIKIKPAPAPPGPSGISITTDPVGSLTASSCPANVTVYGYITTTGGDGLVKVRLAEVLISGATFYSGTATVSVQGKGTYKIQGTFLVQNHQAGDFSFVVDSPVSIGSAPQSFALNC